MDASTLSVVKIVTPELWKLDNTRRPDNISTVKNVINFMESHPEIIHTQPTYFKEFSQLFDITSFDGGDLSKREWKICDRLHDKYPHLFPLSINQEVTSVKIVVGNQVTQVPKNILLMRSEKFQRMFSQSMKESGECLLNLEGSLYDEASITSFLKYLSTGKFDINGENVLSLAKMADEHGLVDLMRECVSFFTIKPTNDEVVGVINYAFENNLYELLWVSLNHCQDLSLDQIKQCPKDLEPVLSLLKPLMTHVKALFKYNSDYEIIVLNEEEELDPDTISSFDKLAKLFNLFQDRFLGDRLLSLKLIGYIEVKSLNEIVRLFSHLKKLEYQCFDNDCYHTSVENIKGILSIQKNLESLSIRIPFLKTFEEAVNFFRFIPSVQKPSGLTKFELDFSHIDQLDDEQLEILISNYPIVGKLSVGGNKITKIPFEDRFEEISFHNASALVNYCTLTKASISASFCEALKTVNAPNATCMNLLHCKTLSSVNVPKATTVRVSNCSQLLNVNAISSEQFFCIEECPSIKTIQVPLAKIVSVETCTAVKYISAPNARTLRVKDCPALTKIIISQECVLAEQLPEGCQIEYR